MKSIYCIRCKVSLLTLLYYVPPYVVYRYNRLLYRASCHVVPCHIPQTHLLVHTLGFQGEPKTQPLPPCCCEVSARRHPYRTVRARPKHVQPRLGTVNGYCTVPIALQVPAATALAAGLVDHVVDASAPDLVEAAVSFARGRLPQVAGGIGALRTGSRLLKVGTP